MARPPGMGSSSSGTPVATTAPLVTAVQARSEQCATTREAGSVGEGSLRYGNSPRPSDPIASEPPDLTHTPLSPGGWASVDTLALVHSTSSQCVVFKEVA